MITKLIGFITLLIAVARLAWKLVKLAWHRSWQLRPLVDGVGRVVSDDALMAGTLSLSNRATATVVNRSAELQQLSTAVGALLESPLPESMLPIATRSIAFATANHDKVAILAQRADHLMQTPLPAAGLDFAIRALETTNTTMPFVVQLTRDLEALLATPLATSGIMLAGKGAKILNAYHAEFKTLANDVFTVLGNPPTFALTPEFFELTQKGATLYVTKSPQLLQLMTDSGDLLDIAGTAMIESGKAAIQFGYVLRGRTGMPAAPAEVASEIPAAPSSSVPHLSGTVLAAANAVYDGTLKLNDALGTVGGIEIADGVTSTPTPVPVCVPSPDPPYFSASHVDVPGNLDVHTTKPFETSMNALKQEITGVDQPLPQSERTLRNMSVTLDQAGKDVYQRGLQLISSGKAVKAIASAL